ncbi:MAG: helix-turn-helix domain-containing protein [Lactococcus petauri]
MQEAPLTGAICLFFFVAFRTSSNYILYFRTNSKKRQVKTLKRRFYMFYERLKLLAKENKKSFNEIEEDLGLSKNLLYKYSKFEPKQETINQLAKYFHVTSDYLTGKTTSRTLDLAELDQEIVASNLSYSGKPLTENDRHALNNILREYFESQEDE